MRKDNGNYGVRYKLASKPAGGFEDNGYYVALTGQSILDLYEIVKAGYSSEEIVDLLKDAVYKASVT